MKRSIIAAAIAVLLLSAPGCATTHGRAHVGASVVEAGGAFGVSYFYDDLAPYGTWIEYSRYGWCWVPYDTYPNWRPYHDGGWIYTEFGWTWVTDEPWGWATYHYGRWIFDPFHGWIWVPGAVWAPAWVAWHAGDEWVGWAPLPPTAGWSVSIGLRFGDVGRIPPTHWCFVQPRYLVETNVCSRIAPVARNVTLLGHTRDATRFSVREGRPINQGIDAAVVERASGRSVRRLEVVDLDPGRRGRGHRVRGGRVEFFRPTIRERELRAGPPPEVRRRESAVPTPMPRKEMDRERRRLEQALAKERARLEREHERERIVVSPRTSTDEVRRRHADERLAFERHAAQQRQVLEERLQRRTARIDRQEKPPKPAPKGKGKQRGRS